MLETAYKILTDFFIRSQIIRLFFMLSILSRAGFVFGRWGLMRKNEHRDLLHITLCAQLLLIHITCWLHFNVLSSQIFVGQGACVNMLGRGLLLEDNSLFWGWFNFPSEGAESYLNHVAGWDADKVLNMKGSDEVFLQQIRYKSRSSFHLYTL